MVAMAAFGCGGSTTSSVGDTHPGTGGGGSGASGTGMGGTAASAGGSAIGGAGGSGAGGSGAGGLAMAGAGGSGNSPGAGGGDGGSGGPPACHPPWTGPADYPPLFSDPGSCYVSPCGNNEVCCAKYCVPGYCDMVCGGAGNPTCHMNCWTTLTCVLQGECPTDGVIAPKSP